MTIRAYLSKGDYDLIHIAKRGPVFTTTLPQALEGGEIRSWNGDYIDVDGCVYEILGVELYALPNWRLQDKVGFLVRGPV